MSAQLVWDYDDDPGHCQPEPEICGDGVDQDCNGFTDDTDPGYCDAGDLDGCGLGHQMCAGGACLENGYPVPTALVPAASSLVVKMASSEFVFASGTRLAGPTVAGSVDLLASLQAGLALGVPGDAIAGDALVAIELHLARPGALTTWNGQTRLVALRMQASSTNDVAVLDFGRGLVVRRSQPLYLHWSSSAGDPAARFFGCPTGEITFPERLPVVDVCLDGQGTCGP